MKRTLFLIAFLVTLMVTVADGQAPQGGRAGGRGAVPPGGGPGGGGRGPAMTTPKAAIPNAKAVMSCDNLASVKLPNTTIESAAVSPGNPNVCMVTAVTTHPPAGDKVRIWVAIPTTNWNGRFLGNGGGGFSGGNIARPALQRLLEDVRAGKIDIIVVYKVDRLTRSLADFAKLVELFDRHGVSFVSVTQQFNTTTSMGRLTLNVLLSFAQFEREVTSERIRDKVAASKRKGLWVGGVVALGYQAKDRKITVVADEAKTVRHIFRRYLDLGSLNLLLTDLRRTGIKTKLRPLSNGRTIGGIPFTRGSLAALLRNRFYIGEVRYKGEVFPGEQPAILDRALFEAVQTKLDQQRTNHAKTRQQSQSLLMGRIFDDRGNRMTPSHAVQNGVSRFMRHNVVGQARIHRRRRHVIARILGVRLKVSEQQSDFLRAVECVRLPQSMRIDFEPLAVAVGIRL